MPKGGPVIEFEYVGDKAIVQRLGNYREFYLGAMLTIFRRIGAAFVPAIKSKTPIGATSKLRNTTVYQVLGMAEDMRLEVRQSAFSPNRFPYGVAVRQGTRPHFPPIAALIPWVVKKLGIGDEKQARTVAFLIARKISRVGTAANPYHARAFQSQVGMIHQVISEEAAKLAARII